MIGPVISLMYTCHECGVEEDEVIVREHLGTEDILHWVDYALGVVNASHCNSSPCCRSKMVELRVPELRIPVMGDATQVTETA